MNLYLLFFGVSVVVFWYIGREDKKETVVAEENDRYEFCSGYLHRRDSKMPESCLNNFESEQCRLEFRELNAEAISQRECFLKCMGGDAV